MIGNRTGIKVFEEVYKMSMPLTNNQFKITIHIPYCGYT